MGNELHAAASRVSESEPLIIGRYELAAQLARGGLATVYIARLLGDSGLRRTVAVKRLHAQFRTDGDITTMFLDEARVALRVRHPNVVHAVDVVLHEDELFIVMEYVEGASLSQLLRNAGKTNQPIPLDIASAIVANVLHGLHAAHTTRDERGVALGIVHRDVSPQNVLVGSDGIARVLDFGIAKTVSQAHVTRTNEIKGKLTYMAPEQVLGQPLARTADIFAAGIIFWESLTGHRLFYGDNDGAIVRSLLENPIPPPSSLNPAISPELDALVLRALERQPERRFQTAEEMASRIEELVPVASSRATAAWVKEVAGAELEARAKLVARVESRTSDAPVREDISRSRTRLAASRLPGDEGEPPALARALRALDAQRQAERPARRGKLVPILLGAILLSLTGFGAWHRLAQRTPAPSVSVADEQAVTVSPLTVPPPSAAVSSAAASVAAPGATVIGTETAPAATATSTPPLTPTRAARGATSPVRSAAPRAAPSASVNRYSRF